MGPGGRRDGGRAGDGVVAVADEQCGVGGRELGVPTVAGLRVARLGPCPCLAGLRSMADWVPPMGLSAAVGQPACGAAGAPILQAAGRVAGWRLLRCKDGTESALNAAQHLTVLGNAAGTFRTEATAATFDCTGGLRSASAGRRAVSAGIDNFFCFTWGYESQKPLSQGFPMVGIHLSVSECCGSNGSVGRRQRYSLLDSFREAMPKLSYTGRRCNL